MRRPGCPARRRRTPDVCRGSGAAAAPGSISPAHTPVALITARAVTSNDPPPRMSVSRADVAGDIRGADVGQDPRAVLGGGAGDRRDQSGIVDQLPVVGEKRAVEAVAAHRGRQFDGPLGGDASGSRQRRGRGAGQPAQRIPCGGIRFAPAPAPHGPSTAAAAPVAASPAPDEERCASSGFRVRPRCAGRFRRCRWPGNAARRGPVSNSTGWCRTPGRAFPPARPTARGRRRPARYPCR